MAVELNVRIVTKVQEKVKAGAHDALCEYNAIKNSRVDLRRL